MGFATHEHYGRAVQGLVVDARPIRLQHLKNALVGRHPQVLSCTGISATRSEAGNFPRCSFVLAPALPLEHSPSEHCTMFAFIVKLPSLPLSRACCKPQICSRTPPTAQAQSGSQGEYQWDDSASTQPGLQQIEFIIRPNGIVEEHITGLKGAECQKVG